MSARIETLAEEAEEQLLGGLWRPTPGEVALARKSAVGLLEVIAPAAAQEGLALIDRLEHLREALAVLAMGTARTHGQLAWFLAQASTALVPVLHWRSLPADKPQSFGTVVPTAGELADAEHAVRRLAEVLSGLAD